MWCRLWTEFYLWCSQLYLTFHMLQPFVLYGLSYEAICVAYPMWCRHWCNTMWFRHCCCTCHVQRVVLHVSCGCSQWNYTIHVVQPVEFHLLMWYSEWCCMFHVVQSLVLHIWCGSASGTVLHELQPVELHVSHGVVSGFCVACEA